MRMERPDCFALSPLPRRVQILRHRQGLEEMLRQRDLAKKRQESEHKSKFNKTATRTGFEQMAVVQRLNLDLPEALLTVSCLLLHSFVSLVLNRPLPFQGF